MNTIIYLLQVTACTAVFYLFYFLFLSRLTFFATNRWYLLATVLLSFLLPLLRITLSEQQPYVAAVQHMIYVPQTAQPETQIVVQQAPVADEPVHWDAIFKIAYFSMAIALGIHLLVTMLSFFKRIKGKRIAKIGKVNILSGQQKIANGSFLNYIFLNEDELSPDEIAQIIAHEMLHIKLYHSIDRILVKIAQIILWFNPFIYWYARSVEENHEFEVDREIARSTDKHNYANLLLHLSVAGRGMLYHNFSKVPLKKRINMLFNKPSNKMKKVTYVLIVPVVLISCLAFAKLKKADANHKADVTNIDTAQKITYKQKIKRTPAEAIRYKKQQDDLKKYQQTADYKNKMKLADDVSGKTINVTVKGIIPNKTYPNKQGAILAVYNGHEYAIDSRYGQGKSLTNILKPGDQIALKVFGLGVRSDYPVMIIPAYVIKNKVKIFQLGEADKIPDYPFLYEANKVRFADGQVSNIIKYPNGKWKSALFETVNGYKFNLSFKPSAPDLNSIEWGDHVRLRFVHEVKTGAKTYRINDWVSIATNIKDYGIKNPELFSRFYTEVKNTPAPAFKSSSVGNPSGSVKNSLTTQKIDVLNESIKRKQKIKVLNESIRRKIEKELLEARKKSKVINQPVKNASSIDQYYKRHHFKNDDGTLYDQIVISIPPDGEVMQTLSPTEKPGFIIDKKIYNEDEFRKILPSVVKSFTGSYGTGPTNNSSLNHGLDVSGYDVIFSFNTDNTEDRENSHNVRKTALTENTQNILKKMRAFETGKGKELPEQKNNKEEPRNNIDTSKKTIYQQKVKRPAEQAITPESKKSPLNETIKGAIEQERIEEIKHKMDNKDEFAYKTILVSASDLPFPDTHFGIVVTKRIAARN